jgi:CRP/FNR family transcriptional regulator/CRP/FNR family cyclic AMP-dependent transcriptional regulator
MIIHDPSLLADSQLFGALPPEDRRKIVALCSRRRLAARQVVFYQGEPGKEMFIVLSGELKVSVSSEHGKELSFFIFHENDIFGELALLDGERRSATVAAIGPCELLVLHHHDFQQLLKEHHLIGLKMLSLLAGRVRATTLLYESSVFIEIPGRLAGKLLELAQEHGAEANGGILIGLKLSQYELGTMINASRESVNKQLRIWEGQGIINLRHGKICLLKPHVLEALVCPGHPDSKQV